MADFRKGLYSRYISAFKTKQAKYDYKSYNNWCRHKYLPLLSGVGKDSAILDLGCGAGVTLGFLKSEGYLNARGVDISEEMVSLAVAAGYQAEVANVFDFLTEESHQFDVVFAIDLIEHFTKEELFVLLPLVKNRLKPGGMLIIQTPNGEGMFSGHVVYGDLTHSTILNPGSLKQLLRYFSFEAFLIIETGPAGKSPRHLARRLIWGIARILVQIIRMAETGNRNQILTENMICRCRKPAIE